MQPATPLAITLRFGLRPPAADEPAAHDDDPLEEAERQIGGALGINLAWPDDLELGGAFLEYAPRPLPSAGLAGVRVHANHPMPAMWYAPHRPDLPLVARVELTGSLLEAGRLVETVHARARRAVLASYAVNWPGPDAPAEMWRAHRAILTTDAAAARRWTPERTPVGDDIRWNESAVAPVLTGHLTFALDATDWTAARATAERAFPVAFTAGVDPDLGGDYLEHQSADGSQLLLRKNAIGPYTRLFERDTAFLLDVTMRTQSLLDLGRVAAAVEATGGLTAIAHRAAGDLLHDRVPRFWLGGE